MCLLFLKVGILCIKKDAVLRQKNKLREREGKQVTGCIYGTIWYGNKKKNLEFNIQLLLTVGS